VPDISRIRVVWSGIPTGNGVSTFYAAGGTPPNLAPLRNALANMTTLIPSGITLTIQNQGDFIDDATGALTGSWSQTAQAAIACTGAGVWSAPSGACVNWQTNGIHNGRRLRGRTFFVPLVAACYAAGGGLTSGTITGLQGVVAGLLASGAPKYVIWGRPTKPKNPDGTPLEGGIASGGMSSEITAGTVPTKAMILTSRRD
jgi:hypothetical protein